MKVKPTDLMLWSDATLLAANKPAGLAAVPGGHKPRSNLLEVLEPTFGPLWVVHRLDRNTSGVIVLARTAAAHRALNAQFREHRVFNLYHALVQRDSSWTELTVELPLRPDGDR